MLCRVFAPKSACRAKKRYWTRLKARRRWKVLISLMSLPMALRRKSSPLRPCDQKTKLGSCMRVITIGSVMESRSKFRSLLFAFAASVIFFFPSASAAQQPPAKPPVTPRELKPEEREWLDNRTVKKITPPSGTGFYIEALASPPGRYSMSLSDGEGRSMSDTFTQTQVDIFEAIMIEAKKFTWKTWIQSS